MARVKRAVVVDRKMRMLSYLVERASSQGASSAVLSLRTIGADLELSEGQVRIALRSLKSDGMLLVEAREMPNGGTAENAYSVMPRGRRAIALYGEAMAAEAERAERRCWGETAWDEEADQRA